MKAYRKQDIVTPPHRTGNVRTIDELHMMQALPLELKIAKTKLRIREFVTQIGEENCVISFSGGKDSTVLLHLIREEFPNIRAVFADTGLEYPEVRAFARGESNLKVLRPEKSFKQVVTEYGYPVVSKEVARAVWFAKRGGNWAIKKLSGERLTADGKKSKFNMEKYKPLLDAPFTMSDKCCAVMKKNLFKPYPNQFLGTMASESRLRVQGWLKTGCNSFQGDKNTCKPLSFWNENDVLQYLVMHTLPIATVYGDIVCTSTEPCKTYTTTKCKRTGCVFCGFGAHIEKESRFLLLKETHPKLYNYCMNGGAFDPVDNLWKPTDEGLGMRFVFEWLNNNLDNFHVNF